MNTPDSTLNDNQTARDIRGGYGAFAPIKRGDVLAAREHAIKKWRIADNQAGSLWAAHADALEEVVGVLNVMLGYEAEDKRGGVS